MAEKILLHVCCGPCAIMPAKRLLAEGLEVVFWFMNPNIHPLSEYLRRREAAEQCAERLSVKIIYDDAAWDLPQWLEKQRPWTQERCHNCVSWRLEAAWKAACELGIGLFSSSLLYSRYQPHDFIAQTGKALAEQGGPQFVYRDFRTDWQAGIDASIEWGLYRQAWCGCIFSENERYAKKLARLLKKPGPA